MADNEYPKKFDVASYPVLNNNSSHLVKRIEPILTPKKLMSRYLKGIDMSAYDNDELKDLINVAINNVELLIDVPLVPEQKREKHPYDRSLYNSYVHTVTNYGPILQIDDFSIVGSDQDNLFRIPSAWLDPSLFFQRQINVIPLTVLGATSASTSATGGPAGLAFLSALQGSVHWIPSYFQVTYTVGVCNKAGHVPMPVNHLVGVMTAIQILGQLGALNTNTSQSVSHDGISQSSSSPGPAVYQTRIGELTAEKDETIKKLKKIYNTKYFVGNI